MKPSDGACKLCGSSAGALQRSHFIPAAAHKLIQKTTNEAPVVAGKPLTIQTNQQITAHILCKACENLLSSNGEQCPCRFLEYSPQSTRQIRFPETQALKHPIVPSQPA